jgi:polar amino acid transport system substrate-binding protein
VVGEPYGTAPQGIAIPKGNGMSRPVRDAMKNLMANGTYAAILRKWGVENGAVRGPVINAAGG